MEIADSNRLRYALISVDSAEDVELMYQLDQDPEVMRYVTGGATTTREDIQKIFIPRMVRYTNPDKGWGLWKVTEVQRDEFLGWILVRPTDFFTDKADFSNLELGWRFSRNSWGQGYATEAAQSIAQALVENGGLKKLSAIALEDNLASIGIMKKLGMCFIKKYVHKDPQFGEEEVVSYELKL